MCECILSQCTQYPEFLNSELIQIKNIYLL